MKVLITGGAGFIGSHLTDRLLARGDLVLVLDNYATGRPDNLSPQSALHIVEGTITDEKIVSRTFDAFEPEIVVHAAASYKDPDNWEEDALTNVVGSINCVKASRRLGVKRFIYFQTSLCYGLKPLEQPITLNHPVQPSGSSYAISKTAAEQYLQLSGLDYISFRLANAYGPRNLSGPIPTFFHRLMNNQPCFVMKTRRDFIYIDDLLDVVLMAIDGQGEGGIYHISTGSDFAIKEVFDAVVLSLGLKLDRLVEEREPAPDDVFTILLDPSKTIQEFGWKPLTPLEKGVDAAVDWYKKNGITQTYTHLVLPKNS
ncbi:NAD-dependent epimerase/dehydratase family protein [Thermodesulfobacteriota bacterium]